MAPRISIVTPSFNQAAYVGWTVRSVLEQRYSDVEYIVMDGGSTDGTADVLAPYRRRFAHFRSGPDGGQSSAIRDGFEHAGGEILAWVNSDDMLAPGALAWVARYFDAHPEVDAVYSHRVIVDAHNRCVGYWMLPGHDDAKMLRWDLIPQETCFWRRSLYDRVGGVDASFRFAMDYDLFVRFMRTGRMVRVPRALGAFRQHDEAKTTRQLETIGRAEIERIHAAYDIRFAPRDRLRGRRFWHGMKVRSAWHARRRRRLPGALPGLGWNYDELWGGMLDEGATAPAGAAA